LAEKRKDEAPKITIVLKDSDESRRERQELMEKLFPVKRFTRKDLDRKIKTLQ
jgi:hypothetical protein